jgi:hypothetical protein
MLVPHFHPAEADDVVKVNRSAAEQRRGVADELHIGRDSAASSPASAAARLSVSQHRFLIRRQKVQKAQNGKAI